MTDEKWQLFEADYADEERKELIDRRVIGEPFGPFSEGAPALWLTPRQIGATQARELRRVKLSDGTVVYRQTEITRLS